MSIIVSFSIGVIVGLGGCIAIGGQRGSYKLKKGGEEMLGITTILTTQAAINIIQAFAFGVTTGAEIYQAANNYDNRKVNN